MFMLSDVLTYMRRIIKSPSNAVVSDNLLIDYVNRFWITDVDARMQLFDLKTTYQFQTQPGVDQYNMPLYSLQTQPGSQVISMFPVYQGFLAPARINGVPVSFYTDRSLFFNAFGNVVQNQSAVAIGNGGTTYTINMPITPNGTIPPNPPYDYLLRGHVDITGIISTQINVDPPVFNSLEAISATDGIPSIPTTNVFPAIYITSTAADGSNVVVADSGTFLDGSINYGLLMSPGPAPFGNTALNPGTDGMNYSTLSNTISYFTGVANVTFPVPIPVGTNINAQCIFYESGLPRGILYYNNTLCLRVPPAMQYLVEIEAYLSPAAFLTTSQSLPFGYMAEYLARGAARKYLSDVGDIEQFMFYEPLFKEQELLVWKRSQRQWTSTRTETIYSQGRGTGNMSTYSGGGAVL